MPQALPPPPPKLQFDDGVRTAAIGSHVNDTDTATSEAFPENPRLQYLQQPQSAATTDATSNNVYEYYEIERLVTEIRHIVTAVICSSPAQQQQVRVAIQLPDELLMDAMEICHEFERAFHHHDNNVHHEYQVYVLGDTTYAPCCPDRIASEHLQSHILIHYGHACFSNIHHPHDPTQSHHHHTGIPPPSSQPPQPPQYPIVLYSFGKQMISVPQCAQDVRQELYHQRTTIGQYPQNILLLYEVQYAHAMKDLRKMLQTSPVPPPTTTTTTTTDHDHSSQLELFIKMGRIPQLNDVVNETPLSTLSSSSSSSFQPPTSANRNTIVDEQHHCCRNDVATTAQSQKETLRSCCHDGSLSKVGDNHDDHLNNSEIPLTSTETVMSTTTSPHLESDTTNPSNGTRSTTTMMNEINQQYHHIMVGGLELPHPFSSSHNLNHTDDDDWVCQNHEGTGSFDKTEDTISYIILYIGDVTSRPFLNIVLRFLSSSNVTCIDCYNNNDNNMEPLQKYHLSSIWAWTPTTASLTDHETKTERPSRGRLCTDILQKSNVFHKILQRRYYLIQKAKHCTTFGIIVAHMTPNIQSFVQSIKQYLDQQHNNDRTISHYTFVVGKINPTKLANFPEIDCFILVACPEHALLQNERELYPIPIITPYELLVAFSSGNYNKNSNIEWGDTPYSTHPNDYWALSSAVTDLSLTDHGIVNHDGDIDDNDDDAPYFSLVTGQYETRTKSVVAEASTASIENAVVSSKEDAKTGNGITTLSTRFDGTIVQYGTGKRTSAAADFLKHREYQGLVMMTPYEGQQRDQGNGDNIDDNKADDITENTIGNVQPAVLGRTGIASNYGNR